MKTRFILIQIHNDQVKKINAKVVAVSPKHISSMEEYKDINDKTKICTEIHMSNGVLYLSSYSVEEIQQMILAGNNPQAKTSKDGYFTHGA